MTSRSIEFVFIATPFPLLKLFNRTHQALRPYEIHELALETNLVVRDFNHEWQHVQQTLSTSYRKNIFETQVKLAVLLKKYNQAKLTTGQMLIARDLLLIDDDYRGATLVAELNAFATSDPAYEAIWANVQKLAKAKGDHRDELKKLLISFDQQIQYQLIKNGDDPALNSAIRYLQL